MEILILLLNILAVTLLFEVSFCVGSLSSTRINQTKELQTVNDRNPPTWSVIFESNKINITMEEIKIVPFTINYIDSNWGDDFEFHVLSYDQDLLDVKKIIRAEDIPKDVHKFNGFISMKATFLGHTKVFVELQRTNFEPEISTEMLDVIILRNAGMLDIIFKVTVAIFVMLIYINFGAALDLQALKSIILRPIGPLIGFIGQFVIMPLLGFSIGYIMFHDMVELRLGLFFAATSPCGGASNMWTVILNGNLNLSITMTAISNITAFGMMPLWIFTLGALIFRDGNFVLPYGIIGLLSFSLVIPLGLGILIQLFYPKVAMVMSKYLKPISIAFIIVIMIFAFSVNTYIFRLFTWNIIIASSALSWLGFLLGWLLAKILRQSSADAITIAIETGLQNTGIAIFMLNFTLSQPEADMTTAVPVANSIMTPLPLIALYLIKKFCLRKSIEETEEAPTKEAGIIEIETIMDKGKFNSINLDEK